MRANSRQRERRLSTGAVGCDVAPGGKSLSREDELFDQTGDEQFSLQPSFGTVFVGLLEVSELQQRFQPLEQVGDILPINIQSLKS